ncbi:hypothetical protein WMY93_021376 [Mugilogobius chulae]|uniref:CPL domain-containing protein n=1 Tax=Mugilogobius chulae TaxID=88201 RepID=A0AAW0NMX1_9GOBI
MAVDTVRSIDTAYSTHRILSTLTVKGFTSGHMEIALLIKPISHSKMGVCSPGSAGHLDCVDDTKLVKQAVLSELLSSLSEVLGNKYGKKVMAYLLNPRDPAHLLPETIQLLQKGDGNQHSKKEASIRRRELLEVVSPPLLQHLCDNAAKMATDNPAV